MTRDEAIAAVEAAGLRSPRIIPHKGKGGNVEWRLYHGQAQDRRVVVLPVNVDKKRLHQAVEQANGQT